MVSGEKNDIEMRLFVMPQTTISHTGLNRMGTPYLIAFFGPDFTFLNLRLSVFSKFCTTGRFGYVLEMRESSKWVFTDKPYKLCNWHTKYVAS